MTLHAIERARERYGLEFTAMEVGAIGAACISGKGMLARVSKNGDRKTYVIRWSGDILVPVMTLSGIVLTFEPRDTFAAGQLRARGVIHNWRKTHRAKKSARKLWAK